MNVSIFSQKAYENISDWTFGENKPNQTQFQPKNEANKPKTNPISIPNMRKQTQSNPISKQRVLWDFGFGVWDFVSYNIYRGESKRQFEAKRPIKTLFKGGDSYMGGWRTKLVFLLIVYFAGFATAIYCLAPVPENQTSQPDEKSLAYSVLKSDEFAQSFNTGMHKCVDFVKDIAQHAGSFLNQKTNLEHRTGS